MADLPVSSVLGNMHASKGSDSFCTFVIASVTKQSSNAASTMHKTLIAPMALWLDCHAASLLAMAKNSN
jgi:hypothetical protein